MTSLDGKKGLKVHESQCFGGRLVPLTQFFVFERDLCLGVPRALKSDKLSNI